jgi:hypothetical protein
MANGQLSFKVRASRGHLTIRKTKPREARTLNDNRPLAIEH